MPEYVYRAITKEGVIVRNKVDSPSKQTLIKRLKAGELLPIDIVQVGYGLGKKKVARKRQAEAAKKRLSEKPKRPRKRKIKPFLY